MSQDEIPGMSPDPPEPAKGSRRKTPAKQAPTKSAAAKKPAASVAPTPAPEPPADEAPPAPPHPAERGASTPSSAGAGQFTSVDLDAETSVLGALLTTPELFFDISEKLTPEDFGVASHVEIYRAILACDAARRPLDQITVADELKRAGQLAKVGGTQTLERLVERAQRMENVLAHADIVAEKSLLRKLVSTARGIAVEAMGGELPAPEVLSHAEAKVFELGQVKTGSSMVEMPQAVAETLAQIHNVRSQLLLGHSTGFKDLDRMTGGFQGGQLIVIAARPGAGKTSAALQIARSIAETSGKLVPFLTFEMSRNELTMRMLATALTYDLSQLMQGNIPEGMDRDLAQAAEDLSRLSVLLDDNPPDTMSGVRSAMRRLARRGELGAVVIDYLQLMSGESRRRDDTRTQEISEISRGMKRLATELDVPIIALSQLNRSLESRPNKRPMLSDLRESGCVTADTRLLRADTNTEVTIGELVLTGARNVPVWSLDEAGNLVQANLTHAFPSGRKEVFEVRTAAGRVVRASGNHPFRTLEGWTALEDLSVGSRVAAPRILPASRESVSWDRDLLSLTAHLIGDGCTLASHAVQYTNADPANLDHVEAAAQRSWGVRTHRDELEGHSQLFLSKSPGPGRHPVRAWLEPFGLWNKRAWEKFVPAPVFSMSQEDVAFFLRHLWATDGSLTIQRGLVSCYYATTSRRLADDVVRLLLRFGVVGRVKVVPPAKDTHHIGYQVWIYGALHLRTFCEEIGVHGARGECIPAALAILDAITPNTNVDTLPREVWAQVRAEMRIQGLTTRGYAAALGGSYGGSSHFSLAPSRPHLLRVADILESPALRARCEDDIFWDAVVSIESLGEMEVFDATVEETHNFIANGLVLHNSIEQDASAVLFLYRDHLYHPEADPSHAEMIIGKQRNGPTGIIPLDWNGPATKFSDSDRRLTEPTKPAASTNPFGDKGGSFF